MHWLLAHFIGDYIIQSDWMAANKKKSQVACAIHSNTYLIPFLFCGLLWWQVLLIGIQHHIQDNSNFVIWFMNKSGSKNFTKAPMAPWSIIVVDNIFHVIWITFVIWLGVLV